MDVTFLQEVGWDPKVFSDQWGEMSYKDISRL